jgi:hypothetical protein
LGFPSLPEMQKKILISLLVKWFADKEDDVCALLAKYK